MTSSKSRVIKSYGFLSLTVYKGVFVLGIEHDQVSSTDYNMDSPLNAMTVMDPNIVNNELQLYI